jgi:hypothetical protein
MIDASINENFSSLSASQLAKLLVLLKGLEFGYDYVISDDDGVEMTVTKDLLAQAPGELIDSIFDENEHDDAINEVRYDAEDAHGISEWAHYSWNRNYEVDVKAFILPDGRALAFCEMSGGGKFGEPDSYPWVDEAKFIKVAGFEEKIIKIYKFEEIQE